jgi:hypothetical protein
MQQKPARHQERENPVKPKPERILPGPDHGRPERIRPQVIPDPIPERVRPEPEKRKLQR